MQATPTAERLPLLDVLRGFALCGILLANLLSFTGAVYITVEELHGADWLTRCVLFSIDFLTEGKFYTLFSILFGIGCALQWQRNADSPKQFLPLWYRRMATLLVIGLLHMVFIWYGDILTLYAVLGLSLPLLIKLERQTMLRLVIVLLLSPLLIYAIRYFTVDAAFWQTSAKLAAHLREAWGINELDPITRLTSDDAFSVLGSNISGALQRPISYLQTGRAFKVLGQFLLGFWIGLYLLPQILQSWRPKNSVVIVLTVFAVTSNLAYAYIKNVYASPFMLTPVGAVQSLAYHIGSNTLALCYLLLFLIFWNKGFWQHAIAGKILDALGALGRMSLSNYLGQSLIGILFFYGYGFALMGRVSYATIPLIAAAILSIQWIFCKLWLYRFQQGPMESVWRWFTYRPMRLPL